MTTTIHSNGSGRVLPIEALLERLATHPLDRTFEAFGNFVQLDPVNGRGEPMTGPGGAAFFGNFLTYSHVFRLDTDDPDLIARLTAAIHANQQRPDYLDQSPPFQRDKLEIRRKRFSETQGEVELVYDGRRLEQYGDKIELTRHGWRGHDDRFWEGVARRRLAAEHAQKRQHERAQ